MVDEIEELVGERIIDILPLLRKMNKDSVRWYCYRHIPLLYSNRDATLGSIQDSLLDGYEELRLMYISQAINSAMEMHYPEYTQLIDLITNCIASVLNSSNSLYNCICKAINRDGEEFSYVTNRLYREIISCIYSRYEPTICLGEYDEIYSIVKRYDEEHENRYFFN